MKPVDYAIYRLYRSMGMRAITAFLIAKYGLWMAIELLDERKFPTYEEFIEKWTK